MPVHQRQYTNDQTIYQVFLGKWQQASLRTHREKVFEKLFQVNWERLTDIGISIVYLLGVFENEGPIIVDVEEGEKLGNENRLPSPFALTDMTKPNKVLGTKDDFIKLIAKLHEKKLKVIVDFVPNHTGVAHPWVEQHPDYYEGEVGAKRAEFSGDVYKLNYKNGELRKEMVKVLKNTIDLGADGVRCDMAHLVPVDFWIEAIEEIRSKREDFIFIAEAYADDLMDLEILRGLIRAGFDAVYNEPLVRNIKFVLDEGKSINYIRDYLNFYLNDSLFQSRMVNYLANHDDCPSDNMVAKIKALRALVWCVPGVSFYFNGFLNGFYRRLKHHSYDELAEEMNETNKIDDKVMKWIKWKIEQKPKMVKVCTNPDGLMWVDLKVETGKERLVLNLTDRELELKELKIDGAQARFNEMSDDLMLGPGMAEVFRE